jgi:very-short-patch-repair endonuclease
LPNRRFDFYLPDINTCIEYDGKQHFNFVGTWYQTKEEFERAIQRDKEKTEYCIKNNIKLIRIPYYDYDKLNEEYLKGIIAE